MVLGLIGNIAGNLNQDKFVEGAEAENRLQALQRANFTRDQERLALQNLTVPKPPVVTDVAQGMAGLNLDRFGGSYIDIPPPVVDQEGGVAEVLPLEDPFYKDKILRDFEKSQQGGTGEPPVVPEFDSSKTVINPSDNQNLPNDQIPIPEFQNPDLSALFPEGVVSENDVSDEEKESLHVQGFPWKVIDKNGGKIVVHNGVEYNIKDIIGDGSSFMIVDRYDRPNLLLTDAFTKGRARGITNTELVPRTSSSQDDLAAATVDNSFISNALKSVKNNKFQNEFTASATILADQLGIPRGEALSLLAIESNFGNVGDRKKSKSRGPLQIQSLAFRDVKDYFKGPKPANLNMTDAEWATLTATAGGLPKNHGNLVIAKDQITAGLLYYKMIGLKGVDPKFRAAAYYDGYTKYIGINDISDIKKFSGPNTLASVTKYNSAFLGLQDYLGQVGDYYYPKGGASTAAANNQNIQTTTSSTAVNNQAAGQGSSTTVVNNNQIAGLKTEDASTDTSAKSANTGNTGTSSTDVSSLEIQSGKVGVDDGKPPAKEPKVDTTVKPPAFYTNDPSKLGFDLRNYLEERELIINQTNANLQYQNDLADYYRRFAQIMNTGGTNLTRAKELTQLAMNAEVAANDTRIKGALEAKKAENKIMYLQGMQGLQDLANGSVNRAAMVWSQYSGMDVRINPRSDGKYDITLNGKPYKTMDFAQLSNTLQLAFDQGYRKTQQEASTTKQIKRFENQLEIAKENAKAYNTRQLEVLKGRIEIIKEQSKIDNTVKLENIDGIPYVQRGNSFFIIEPFDYKDNNGDMQTGVREIPVTPPSGSTSSNAYKRN